MKCRIHGSSVVPIPRTCVVASSYLLVACRSIDRASETLLLSDIKVLSCASDSPPGRALMTWGSRLQIPSAPPSSPCPYALRAGRGENRILGRLDAPPHRGGIIVTRAVQRDE